MSDAIIGWGSAVRLWDPSLGTPDFVELVEVVSFSLPDDEVDEVEVTHLKSPGKRREFRSTLIDGGTVDVELNYLPGSATDELIRKCKAAGDVQPIEFVVPDEVGDPAWEVTTGGFVKGYARGPFAAGDKVSATVRLRISGAQSEAAD
ncbi:MAG: phage tail tube protein [Allosphingosinicella sp.]